MLEHFDDNFGKTDAGGNDIAVFRLMTSTASFYNKIKFVSMIMSLVIYFIATPPPPLFPQKGLLAVINALWFFIASKSFKII